MRPKFKVGQIVWTPLNHMCEVKNVCRRVFTDSRLSIEHYIYGIERVDGGQLAKLAYFESELTAHTHMPDYPLDVWFEGVPCYPGTYVLEFPQGDKFGVYRWVDTYPDGVPIEDGPKFESLDNGGWLDIKTATIGDIPIRFCRIPKHDFV